MIRDLLKKAVRTGKGIARFAAMEIRERVSYNAPSTHQPANTESARGSEAEESGNLPLVGELSAKKLKRRLEDETPPALLDCRDFHEWEAGYIDGCVHIPMEELSERYTELDPSQPVVVYCLHGMRSAEVASMLVHKHGFSWARSLEGGIVSWYAEFDQERIVVVRSEDH